MTDQKWAAMLTQTSTEAQFPIKDRGDGHMQAVVLVARYDASASYKAVSARFRADKDEPFDVVMVPDNFDGTAVGAPARKIFETVGRAGFA